MERLTIRRDHGITMAPGYDFGIDPDDYDLVQVILNRLAQYEDTGLRPEEIGPRTRIPKGYALVRMDHLEKLDSFLEAEQDGRLVVLPCKVGDTVWFIRPLDSKKEITETEIEKMVVKGKGIYMKLSCNAMYETSCNSIGKTVFLSHEEAEAALLRAKLAAIPEVEPDEWDLAMLADADAALESREGGKGDG